MQGTNAHVILEQAVTQHAQEPVSQAKALLWQQQRYWIASPAHALLTHTTKPGRLKTARMMADLSTARAAALVHGVTLRGASVASLDLYLEIMAGAVQQLSPQTKSVHLARAVATALGQSGKPPQQLLVTVHDADISIYAGSDASQDLHCQAMVCHHSDTVLTSMTDSIQSQPSALHHMMLHLTKAGSQSEAGATAVAVPWDAGQGFCLPAAASAASAQLQASMLMSHQQACVSTAAGMVTFQPGTSADLLYIVSATKSNHQLDAVLLNNSSSASACQLSAVQLNSVADLAQARQSQDTVSAAEAHMLYTVQWAVATPTVWADQTRQQSLLSQHTRTSSFAPCAALTAAAQQAVLTGLPNFNLTLSVSQPEQGMAVAMLRSIAQERRDINCTAHASTALLGFSISSNIKAAMPAVSQQDSGLTLEPSLMPAYQQQNAIGGVRPASSCIVLGGTGSIGSLVGSWLCSRGVREIVLVGRTGKVSEASQASFAKMLEGQAQPDDLSMVTITRCDGATAEEAAWLYRQSSPVDRYIAGVTCFMKSS